MSPSGRGHDAGNGLVGLLLVGGFTVVAGLVVLLVEWPLLVASSLRGHLTLMAPGEAVGGAVRWLLGGEHGDPRRMEVWSEYRDVLPSPTLWIVLDALLVLTLLAVVVMAAARVDGWRGRREVGLPGWHPRAHVTPRAWARPRDLLHLQPADQRRIGTALARSVRRAATPAPNADSWRLGRLRGAELRSMPESHLMAVAPTRSGKTTRVLIPALLEHDGPAIVLSNKTDVFDATINHRQTLGPVWVYAPMTAPDALRSYACGWTPLEGCEEWEFALRMGRWLLDADPNSTSSDNGSAGARFYNREAFAVALPPLLHAAALGDHSMGDVQDWLRSGVDALDVPRRILEDAGARQAGDAIAGLQALDERPRSLVLMSASQLVDAYRLPAVRAADHAGFSPRLLREGTLYLIAPEGEQEMLAPLLGAILGSTLRHWEQAATTGTPPLLRILADEAAHLAPLAKLPTYLAVSASWNVRWCLIYQSLAQLRDRYGANADTILANVLSKLFMGPIQAEQDRRYLIDAVGEETVTSRSWNSRSTLQASHHERQASKLSAQVLMQLAVGEAVMIHGRDLPAITRLAPYWEL